MSIKKKLPLIFTLLVLCILIANSTLHYMRSKQKLIEFNEKEIELIVQEVSYQIENSKNGAHYVENILGRELRTASIAIKNALPPRHEDVTNEQLQDLAEELMVSHITLLAETEDDIVGVKSSDPHEVGMGTKEWGFWYDAFHQLLDQKTVAVKDGLTLVNYWSGPIEVAASNPDHTDKWGYYYDGSTNYIINPYFRDNQVLEYEKRFGPKNVIERFENTLEGVLEITVFNPEKFGKETRVVNKNGNTFIRIADEPIWYGDGSYQYKNQEVDAEYVHAAAKTGKARNYKGNINGKMVSKTFVPITQDIEDPYVIGLTYDYDLIQKELQEELVQHVLFMIAFVLLVMLASFIFSRSITKPIGTIVEKVNEIAKGNFGGSFELKRKDELGHLAQNVNALSNSLQTYVADLEQSQEVIKFQAFHDPLTGAYNRRYLNKVLNQRIDNFKKNGDGFAVIFIDIDRFKDVNDTLGHAKGDQLIKLISARIKNSLSEETSILTRQGGDEFLLLVSGLEKKDMIAAAETVVAAINQPYFIEGQEVIVSASCGLSLCPEHTEDMDTLLVYADGAMYAAKKQGGNKVVLYNEEISKEKNEKLRIEARLRRAIANEEIEVYYQPKVNAQANVVTGVEALLRWNDKELGFVPPDIFIGIAEDTGLIHRLWEIAMKEACTQVSKWNQDRQEPLRLAVNFSAKQFQDPCSLVKQVKEILTQCKFEPNYFEIEITESTLLYNTNETIKALQGLQEYGISISIDDFGTGYSSFSYLRSLPVNNLKIDRSFIQDISENYEHTEIPEAIIHLASGLRLGIIAEGVEEEWQKEFLLKHNCYHMQGYLFSKPLPKEEFEKWDAQYRSH